jgi:hypothetical protein
MWFVYLWLDQGQMHSGIAMLPNAYHVTLWHPPSLVWDQFVCAGDLSPIILFNLMHDRYPF